MRRPDSIQQKLSGISATDNQGIKMKDIAFHITDITENCIRAGARHIRIDLTLDGNRLELTVTDDGCGMDAETVRKVTDPFYTTRTTRRVGLGLPFLFQNAQQAGGSASVISAAGKGTKVSASFMTDNIDCPPAGDIAGTLMQIIAGNPSVSVEIHFGCGPHSFDISTAEITTALSGLPMGLPDVALMIRDILSSNIGEVFADSLNY